MKTKTLKANKVNVVTLGCSKNIFDSEVMMAQLKANCFDVHHEDKKNDSSIVIINTCGFIDHAKQESIDTILQFAVAKNKGYLEKLYVTGCLSERYKEDLIKEIPEVDAFFGTKDLVPLLKTLKADYKKELIGERLLTTPRHYAYLKIAEGCDRPCSFCAIPLMRGLHRSTPIEELVLSTQKLAEKGVKEIMLIAQDLTYYGLDLYKKRTLSTLLSRLSEVEDIEWIRLHYAFPSGFPMDVIEEMKNNPKICNYLDIPLQHGSSNILQAMKRGITREKTEDLIYQIRDKIPEIAIRTSLIAGFPGETEKDFEETSKFIQKMRFDRLGVFTYSHEENTSAYSLNDDVPVKEKEKRAEKWMDIQSEISLDLNKNKINKTFKVHFDRIENEFLIGRTEFDSPEVDNEVLIAASTLKNPNQFIGTFQQVKINDVTPFDLFGNIL
ncbi:MAG: 30S ribosomal protein S12 methylthiotransferase RimO [Flavobacteriia bacterium]|nr:30S ribosomal protein S12 methylthiotransferase RimO [Flavobacteriia bacterium]